MVIGDMDMKRINLIFHAAAIVAAACAGAWMTGCTKEITNEEILPSEGLRVDIPAVSGKAATRGVAIDPDSAPLIFEASDYVYVWDNRSKFVDTGCLTPTSITGGGSSAHLTGTLYNDGYTTSDLLELVYSPVELPSLSSENDYLDYTGQTGTVESAASKSFAIASVTCQSVNEGKLKIAQDAAEFTTLQSIFRLKFQFKNQSDEDISAPSITSLKISSSNGSIYTSYRLGRLGGDNRGPLTLTAPDMSAEYIYVAMCLYEDGSKNDVLTFTATASNGKVYLGTKSIGASGLQNGKYYRMGTAATPAIDLVEQDKIRPTFLINGVTPGEPSDNIYYIGATSANSSWYISGTSLGYYFYTTGTGTGKTVTIENLDATYNNSTKTLLSIPSSSELVVNGTNNLTNKLYTWAISCIDNNLTVSGNGTLTLTCSTNGSKKGFYSAPTAKSGYVLTLVSSTVVETGVTAYTYTVAPE